MKCEQVVYSHFTLTTISASHLMVELKSQKKCVKAAIGHGGCPLHLQHKSIIITQFLLHPYGNHSIYNEIVFLKHNFTILTEIMF